MNWILALALAAVAQAQSPEPVMRAFLAEPNAQNKRELLRFAEAHPTGTDGALALLAVGSRELRDQSFEAAATHLKDLADRLPQISDYAWFHLGQAYAGLKNHSAAFSTMSLVLRDRKDGVVSPYVGRAAVASASALVELGKPQDAIALLRKHSKRLPQPEGEMELARAFEAAGDDVSAAAHFQKIFYSYPNWEEIQRASDSLVRLKVKLGERFPPAMPQAVLARTKALTDAGRFSDAKRELEAAVAEFGGAERDLAKVRIGGVDVKARQYIPARKYLQSLEVTNAEADAERLYYLVEIARRTDAETETALRELEQKHPQSPWRLEALVNVAYDHLYRNEPDRFQPLYRACADSFPKNQQASFCHWKLTWNNYLQNESDREQVLKTHLKLYPNSEKAPASLYFLARSAETAGALGPAKAYYLECAFRYPNHYYAMLARERLKGDAMHNAPPAPEVNEFVAGLSLPEKRKVLGFATEPVTNVRLGRARLLDSGGLQEWAEAELRFGARNDAQPHLLAMELAKVLEKRGASDEALRAVKAYVPDYLLFPREETPAAFWRVAFPMPFRESVERNARLSEIDPYVVAGLIRQESEFNPRAISRARALGLTQVLPSTGRELSRQTGIRRFTPAMLFTPDVNLRLGTFYIRQLLNSLSGKWEETLASYNGGRSRVMKWATWGNFREPAEFIETIPITETRDYVQIVLRNANVYRELYAGLPPAQPVAAASAPPPAAVAAKVAPPKPVARKAVASSKKPVARTASARAVPKRALRRPASAQ